MTEQDVIAAFAVLECEPGCSPDELKSSYRQLVKVWHPDRFDDNPKLKIKAPEKMKLINDAYQLLERLFEEHHKLNHTQPEKHEHEIGSENVVITKERDPE